MRICLWQRQRERERKSFQSNEARCSHESEKEERKDLRMERDSSKKIGSILCAHEWRQIGVIVLRTIPKDRWMLYLYVR